MSLFDFITNEDFRSSLEADFREMFACINAEAWKAVHVLAGSIVEAVLIDYLLSENLVSKTEALKMDLGDAINLCKDKRIISQKTADLSSVVRDYRNLIHPGRVIRLNESVNRNSAEVAKALVNIVLGEIEKRKRENYGYTAEQIVGKLERDSTAGAIVSHLLKKTNPAEVERLLLKILPERYMQAIEDYETPSHVVPVLILCFRLAFDQASVETKTKTVERFATIFKEESDHVISTYGTAFLRASDLVHASPEDADLIKQHLLARLKNNVDGDLLTALTGIGSILSEKEVIQFADPLIRTVCMGRDTTIKEQAEQCLVDEWRRMPTDIDHRVIKRLDDWIPFYRGRGHEAYADKLGEIKSGLTVEEDDIPF